VTSDVRPRSGRAAGALLLLSALALLGFTVALLREDRAAVTTVLLVFSLVSVPALLAAAFGLPAGVELLRRGGTDRAAALHCALLALGHVGVVALSLRPGLDRELDDGDLAGAAAGAAGLLAAAVGLALLARGRPLAVRLTAALGGTVLVLALLSLRTLTLVD
jgi:hypothetical protein